MAVCSAVIAAAVSDLRCCLALDPDARRYLV